MRRRETTLLKNASLDSIVLAIDHFNPAVGSARLEASIIFAQRALGLLLKATINERTGRIREKGDQYTYGFGRCLNIAVDQLQLLDADARISLQAPVAPRRQRSQPTATVSAYLRRFRRRPPSGFA